MLSLFQKSLSLKILLSLVTILVVSFLGLTFFIVNVQTSSLAGMTSEVVKTLKNMEKTTKKQFGLLESNVQKLFLGMKDKTSLAISTSTQKALKTEEGRLKQSMETLLKKNAEAIAVVFNSVIPSSILGNKFNEIINYSRSAAKIDEIVYTVFLDTQGNPLPAYMNFKDPKIKNYIENGDKDKSKLQRVLTQSKKDPDVMVITMPIVHMEIPLGTTIVCIDKDQVNIEIEQLTKRFSALRQSNDNEIRAVLKNESTDVIKKIKKDLSIVTENNTASIDETSIMLAQSTDKVNFSIKKVIVIVGLICCILIILMISFLIKAIVINPIIEISNGLKDIAKGEGDLTKRLGLTRKDEIGALAEWFDLFMSRLNRIILDIGTNAVTVTQGSKDILDLSEQISKGSEGLSNKANTVAAATEEMDTSMSSVAAVSEQSAINIRGISDAADRMTATMNEVAVNCDLAKQKSGNASDRVEKASGKVDLLGRAAKEINKVTEVITEIAEQTNLLSLNATIEAARAGEAGKGFAVVAGEIKNLATQTARATLDIKEKIQGIQDSTDETTREVTRVAKVILDVDEIVSNIAASVENQSESASDIAKNIEQLSTGINEVSENIFQSSKVTSQISKDISQVHITTEDMSSRSVKMNHRALELSGLATILKDMISVFKV
ncbi:MAG: methyl-accepting chemotaxis protein [Deltaproteobacteria bacterium]|nr:methyl-accepting chemotaxis protein [Deltaproteobacteria bacterium]